MNKIRYRIALLVGSSVIVTILTVMIIFNITINRKTECDARSALNHMKKNSEMTDSDSMYTPETIMIPKESDDESGNSPILTLKEKSIIDWYNDNEIEDIAKTTIDGNTYYILYIDSGEIARDNIYVYGTALTDDICISSTDEYSVFSVTFDDSVESMIAYVDVTGELKMIKRMDLFFILTALLIGTLSAVAGFFVGRRLEQNQLAQKQFFENTSHELKTPLTAIQGYAEGLEKGVIVDLPHTARVITAQTSKMSRMIEEILCIARIESGAVRLETEDIALDELIQNCLMPFEGTVRSKGLNVQLKLAPVKLTGDVDKLEHAVSNLLINAVKYAKNYISVSCSSNMICISNDCEPLPDDSLKHIFDRFYTGRDGNTGIGLSLAKEIIELHGWHISAERTADGVSFIVRMNKL